MNAEQGHQVAPNLLEVVHWIFARVVSDGIGGGGDASKVDAMKETQKYYAKLTQNQKLDEITQMQNRFRESLQNLGVEWAVGAVHQLLNNNRDQLQNKLIIELCAYYVDFLKNNGASGVVASDMIKKLVVEINNRLSRPSKNRQREAEIEGRTITVLEVNPEFALAVYQEIVPALLLINSLGGKRNSTGENVSFEEFADVVEIVMRSASCGKLTIYSQMCAQYARPAVAEHSALAFTRLADSFDQGRIQNAFAAHNTIIEVCNRFGIKVEVVIPQVTAEAVNVPALVPAVFWQYARQGENALARMFKTLNNHQSQMNQMITEALPLSGEGVMLNVESLADVGSHGKSVAIEAIANAQMFKDFHVGYKNLMQQRKAVSGGAGEVIPQGLSWMDLEPEHIREIQTLCYGEDDSDEEIVTQIYATLEWLPNQIAKFQAMLSSLSHEGWGALDDTVKFYSGSSARQQNIYTASVDPNLLVDELLDLRDASFSISEQQARELAEAAVQMEAIKIGSRAAYNVGLYFALGEKLASMNNESQAAFLMPFEEDDDPWGVDAMNAGYIHHRQNYQTTTPGPQYAPIIYPGKKLRQSFAAPSVS